MKDALCFYDIEYSSRRPQNSIICLQLALSQLNYYLSSCVYHSRVCHYVIGVSVVIIFKLKPS